ncbi:alpha-glucosidase family protein [Ferrimonas marina]|uniref:Alpha-glucosidase n=1 Tax=Ferrimonas marina TaxID=299255 RepID=A0A1M5VIB7_9GAMM|nr:alpha-glucosidase family protein [Ferrimonas marina]SHH74940.1 alpha-glucosidase [Ferrimonas marina]
MSSTEWWRGALIYQIYPRSFADSSGNGVGDLNGIHDKLEYVASLGVDGVWISPFFKSPMDDFGYDIADYRDVDPLFGTLEDFDRLLAKAHQLGLKVMIDQVLSHTSDQHAWFQQSRQSRDNDKADWYVWADPKEDGTPPNNWLSIFGGGAWQWEPRREQYYLHNFLTSQPDLNFHNPDVQQAMLDNVEFWLKKGVDGLRLDAINFCFHDAQLRDNPAKPPHLRRGAGFATDNPYAYQYHYHNNTQPENLAFLERLRALLDRYPGTTALGEIASEDSLGTMAEYTQDGRLHMGYSFELLNDNFTAGYIRQTVETFEQRVDQGWPCWAVSNHDVERVASRWSPAEPDAALSKLATALLCSLRGSACLYQGEELGLPEALLSFEQLQDPYGIAFWPNFKGRDGCRTPMPWQQHSEHGGFSEQAPWLPVLPEHLSRAVDRQEAEPDSVLQQFRRLLAWRQQHPALRVGDIRFLDAPEPLLLFVRQCAEQTLLCGFNLSPQPTVLEHASQTFGPCARTVLSGHGLPTATFTHDQLSFPGYGVFYAQLQP